MRRLDFDFREFERPESEERLRLCIAKKDEHPGSAEFLRRAEPSYSTVFTGTASHAWLPISALEGRERIAHYLGRFAGLAFAGDDEVLAIRLHTSVDEEDLMIETGLLRIFYSWETTA